MKLVDVLKTYLFVARTTLKLFEQFREGQDFSVLDGVLDGVECGDGDGIQVLFSHAPFRVNVPDRDAVIFEHQESLDEVRPFVVVSEQFVELGHRNPESFFPDPRFFFLVHLPRRCRPRCSCTS